MCYKFKITIMLSFVLSFLALSLFMPKGRIFFLSYIYAFINIFLVPQIRKKRKYPYILHIFLFYLPFNWILFLKNEIDITVIKITDIKTLLIIFLGTIILLLFNLKDYLGRINGVSSKIKIDKVTFKNQILALIICIVSEEIFFRFYTINNLLKLNLDWKLSVLVSSFLFLVFHYLQKWSNIISVKNYISIFILGLLLSFGYYKTNSLISCIVLHFIFNSSEFIYLLKRFTVKNVECKFDDY